MTRIILVGQAPARGSGRGEPLAGAAGRRLAALAGLSLDEFLSRFERRNLLPEWPGSEARGDRFPLAKARELADEMRAGLAGRRVVLFGRGVANAFRLVHGEDYEWFQPVEVDPGFEAAVVPHPSGVSRWWNEPDNVASAREFMLALKVGFLGQPKRRGKDRYSVAQVAAALEAGRGIYTWAARALSEATGVYCCADTIKGYVARYPEQLGPIFERAQVSVAGMVVEGLVSKAEAGETAVLRELAGMRFVQDIARDRLRVDLRKQIGVEHSGTVRHDVVVQVEEAWQRLVDVLEVDDRPLALTKQ